MTIAAYFGDSRRNAALSIFLFSQPLLLLVVRSWSSAVLMIGALLCVWELAARRRRNLPHAHGNADADSLVLWFSAGFAAWAAATLLAAAMRGHLDWPLLDSPSRFLLAIPVFFYVRSVGVLGPRILGHSAAAGLFLTLGHQTFFPHDHDWMVGRMSNHFADPLSFGYICLSLAFIVLASLLSGLKQPRWVFVFQIAAVAIGLYMSVKTASRTGWAVLPLILLCIVFYRFKAVSLKGICVAAALAMSLLVLGYFVSPTVQERSKATVEEVQAYSFQGLAPETSVGLRITFARMAADLMLENPWTGYGDTQKTRPRMPASVQDYASRDAQDFALSSGFHNETVTNGIQSGVLGVLATLGMFFIPWVIYIHAIRSDNDERRLSGLFGMVFGLTIFVSSISTEVFGLKYTASFYALTTAVLCGLCLRSFNPDSR